MERENTEILYLQFCLKQLWFAMKTQNISQETLFVFGKCVIDFFLQMSLILNISKSFLNHSAFQVAAANIKCTLSSQKCWMGAQEGF